MENKEPVPIAIIGMGCRYAAGANSPEQLWDVIANGREGWSEVPADRFNGHAFYHPDPDAPGAINQKGGYFINQNIADFDPGFFGISAVEAEALDPQQRVILETSWEAVENAGITMEKLRASDTGVFFAMFGHDYEQTSFKDPLSFTQWHNLGIARPLLANRLSYIFDLRGPSVMLDTACSGSLVAVNSACQSLSSGEATMALAGGVGLVFSPDQMALMSLTQLFNGDGRSYTFDDRGNGYGRAEGVGVVVLKRLDNAVRDGDDIRAVIRSSGINSDGHTKGITLPSQEAQERLARSVFCDLPFGPADVQYVEAHGTGTKAGDGVEFRTIRNVFCERRDQDKPLYIGAIKPNIGHSEAASGVAGLIKTVMAMQKGYIPPQLLLENYKPGLEPDPDRWDIRIAKELTPWPYTSSTRKAVVNSFGFGGTNALVVLESPSIQLHQKGVKAITGDAVNVKNYEVASSELLYREPLVDLKTDRLFTVSAGSQHSLKHMAENLRTYLRNHRNVDIDDLSYTLTNRRSNFQWRSGVMAQDIESLINSLGDEALKLTKASGQAANVFVFTGQGAQWARMGYEILQSGDTEFSRSIRRSDSLLKDLGARWNLIDELLKDEASSQINHSRYGQPASTAVQIALVDLFKSWNVLPAAVVGHSSGEIAAAYAAGAISQVSAMRVSYERSFLAEKSKKRSSQSGAMLAVGISEEGVARYIERLGSNHGKVVVACLNSPSSTTLSGDVEAIKELKRTLDVDGIFARQLKVDTAYHSHYMQAVSNDYLSALRGLESSLTEASVRYFSTVSGQEKHGGFGPAYWVDNLVSQVRFSDTIQHVCREMGNMAPMNLIEIGPHKTLAAPIRQILTPQGDTLSWAYISTLVRGENSLSSLLRTALSLFVAGSDMCIGRAASLGISTPSPKHLHNLPPYCWNHTIPYWNESRLSREHRHRRHPHHDLLGLRITTSPDSQPSWRLLLRIDRMPWLRDHVVDDFVVFPAAGYMCMAIQALSQLDSDLERPDAVRKGYRLRNVRFKTTLTIPKEAKNAGVETVITLRWDDVSESWGFTVFSVSELKKWQEHCDGSISTVSEADLDEGDQALELNLRQNSRREHLREAQQGCTKIISHGTMYADMAATGNHFGPCFSINKEARVSDDQSLNILEIPHISAIMPSQFCQPHVIHPATLDGIIQTCLPVFKQHSVPGSVMPLFISDTYIFASISNLPGDTFTVVCDLKDTFPRSTNFDATVFQIDDNGQQRCVLTMTKGEIRVVGETQALLQKPTNDNIFKLQWGLDSGSVTASILESIIIPLQSDDAGITQAQKVDRTSVACARYIDWAVCEVLEKELVVKNDHRTNWWKTLLKYHASEEFKALLARSPENKEDLDKLTSTLGIEGEAVACIGPELVALITGKTDPLTHFLKDDLLFRVYHSDEAARPNRYMAEYAHVLTFQHPKLRILELGAGTGGTTLQILRQCSPNGQEFCAEYMYTDISSGFFETVKTTRLKDWAHLITFQTLDLEKDPVEQGFDEGVYDLVVAANVVHATRSLDKSLQTIYRLLKPGGTLGLVELTRTTPYINMTFGSIPGWWAGVNEGRLDSPLQSSEQWDKRLKNAGFTGIDIAAYDLPEPERHSALLLSRRLPIDEMRNEVHGAVNSVHFLTALPNGHPGATVLRSLKHRLSSLGLELLEEEWWERSVDESTSYLIVDAADHLLIQDATPDQFYKITSILTRARKVFWITLGDTSGTIIPGNALTTGLSRTARNENPQLNCFTVDVQALLAKDTEDISHAIAKFISITEAKILTHQTLEFELMYRNGRMHIQRLVPDAKLLKSISLNKDEQVSETPFHQAERSFKLHLAKPGLLNSLIFIDDPAFAKDLDPDEVEIKAYAFGLNFSDVFIALGQLPPTQPMVGECAGVISRVGANFSSQFKAGDRVAAMFATPYASRARTNGHLVHKCPESIGFREAASIPLAYGTAWYALVECAHLESGQTVLIHAASGGLGQAAVNIAQTIGATVFATVSSAEKKRVLTDAYDIPEGHIFSSRTADFAAGVKRLTNGQGVDVVLNSLSGGMLQASWETVAPFGIFVEVGKTDIYRRSQLSMEPFRNNLKFASIDLVLLAQKRPAYVGKLLRRIWRDVEAGKLSALPVTSFPIGKLEKAFRLMQNRKHTGKIVLEAGERDAVLARIADLRLKGDATYIIVGGLGGLGKLICRHLQMRGARCVVLFTRQRLEPSNKAKVEMELMEATDAVVKVVTCDVTDADAVAKVASSLQESMPPVKGILHGGMVLSDNLISKISHTDFFTALAPKVQGTNNLYAAFPPTTLDFLILMSSLCATIGTLGQSNYAAGGTYQDMFAHARVSEGHTNIVTIDFPLIQNTYPVTQDRILSLDRQGCQYLDISTVWPVLDYVMSGAAGRDGNHQLAWGLNPQSFIDQAEQGTRVPPLFRNIMAHKDNAAVKQTGENDTKRSVDDQIVHAETREEVVSLMLEAIQTKIASLTALDLADLKVDMPVINMALDSLVATEIKNWITNTLQARVQTSDIMDAPSLRTLAKFVAMGSGLVQSQLKHAGDVNGNVNGNGDVEGSGKDNNQKEEDVQLPKYPLPPLETTMEIFMDSAAHLGSEAELKLTKKAVAQFLSPDGVGRRMQSRLEQLAAHDSRADEVVDMYVRNKWLRGRDWSPRLRNFFATLPFTEQPRTQAERAVEIALAAYAYKRSLDEGTVQKELLGDYALSMDTIYWLFNSNRTPVLKCDRPDRYHGNDFIVVMRKGHAWRVDLKQKGSKILGYGQLKTIFQGIQQERLDQVNWAGLLSTAHRDEWAETRQKIMLASRANASFVSAVESCLFIVCLDDASPTTATERANCFILDDNSNRWLDKTLSFIVCANGVSAIFGEHTMVDGTTFGGLIKAITSASVVGVMQNGDAVRSESSLNKEVTYLPFIMPTTMENYVPRLLSAHIAAHEGYRLCNYELDYGTTYCRHHKLPPKSVMQLLIQLAVRRHLGYNPLAAVDVISQRPFRGGRTDMIYVMTPPVQAFCAIAEDPSVSMVERRKKFLEAIKSHARLMTLSTRGRGFRWPLMALKEMKEEHEELPDLYNDGLYQKTNDRPVCTSFTEFGLPEMGRCQPKREDIWVGCQVLEEGVRFTVIDGVGGSDMFVVHLREAGVVMKDIVEACGGGVEINLKGHVPSEVKGALAF